MFVRLPLLLSLLLSLAFGPVRQVAACADARVCASCCADREMVCCVVPGKSAPAETPASVAPQSADLKQLVSPSLVFLGLAPLPAMERPSVHQRQAARLPVPPRLEVTCIRLI
jgi:hypothetical protein